MASHFGFKAEDKSIADILFAENRFRIPRYQRPYEWTTNEVEDFWSDIHGGGDSFFLGSFVLNLEYLEKEKILEVIDGQQRLLTISIFMSVVRDLAREIKEEDLANRIQLKCIAFEDRRGNQTYRIECGDSLKEFFEKYIQTENNLQESSKPSKEEKLIIDNYFYLAERVRGELSNLTTQSQKKELLQGLWDKVADLRIIRIDITSEEAAYTIFETVNARGAELSVADLLKNFIFKNIRSKKDGVDLAKKKWHEMQENISEADLDLSKFIRHYWLSKYSFVTEKTLYREIKKTISDFDGFLDGLVDASALYNKIVVGNKKDWDEVEEGRKIFDAIQGIRAMGVSQCYVLFLCLLRNEKKIGFDLDSYFKEIENFTFNYSAVCKLQANKVEKIYSRVAIDIEKALATSDKKYLKRNVQRVLDTLVHELRELRPAYGIFKEDFMDICYKNSSPSRILIKYILSRINREVSSGEFELDYDVVTIEHVLPQRPNKDWGLKRGGIKDYVNLLGNLTLVHQSINSKASNRSLREKLEFLKKTDIISTKHLVATIVDGGLVWDKDEILKRQKELAQESYEKIWKF